jgi:hypothetical protein
MTEYSECIDKAMDMVCGSYGVPKSVLIELIDMAIEYGEQSVIDNPLDYIDLVDFAPDRE